VWLILESTPTSFAMCSDSEDVVCLAAKRSKIKWSTDPRNTYWSNDTSRFGYRMLEKMGWRNGRGLGLNEDGKSEHIKIKKKENNLGKISHIASWYYLLEFKNGYSVADTLWAWEYLLASLCGNCLWVWHFIINYTIKNSYYNVFIN
jgi:hypothetical protein